MGTKVLLEMVGENRQLLVSHIPHAQAIGLAIIEAKPDEAWLRVPYSADLVGNPATGVVHGGVITTLLDNAAGTAVMAALEEPRSIATLDLRIDYMKPATPGLDIVGYCRCYKMTRSIAFVRGVAYHESPEDPIATMVATFMLGANRALPAVFAQDT
ncbi:MAG: PaaI family thioesterase [Candidatus Binatia bacterium]